MKAALLAVVFASALLPVIAEAEGVLVNETIVVGGGSLSNESHFVLTAAKGSVTIGRFNRAIDEGKYTRIVNGVATTETCTIQPESVIRCAQLTLLCGPTLQPHIVLAGIPGSQPPFKGSIDGTDVNIGTISILCIQVP